MTTTAARLKQKSILIERYKTGKIDLPEAMVRIKGLRKGWNENKIQKRIAWRRRGSKAWAIREKIPFRPLGGLIADGGKMIEAGIAKLQDMKIS